MKYVMQYKIFKIMVNSQFYRNIEIFGYDIDFPE